jgi:hypothetical protein
VPTHKRVRRDNRGDLIEHLSTKCLAFDGKAAVLGIVEEDAFLPELLLEELVLRGQVFDDLLLVTVDPAGKSEQEQVPRV